MKYKKCEYNDCKPNITSVSFFLYWDIEGGEGRGLFCLGAYSSKYCVIIKFLILYTFYVI